MNKIMLGFVCFFLFPRQRTLSSFEGVSQRHCEHSSILPWQGKIIFCLVETILSAHTTSFGSFLGSENCHKHIGNTIPISAVCTCVNYSNLNYSNCRNNSSFSSVHIREVLKLHELLKFCWFLSFRMRWLLQNCWILYLEMKVFHHKRDHSGSVTAPGLPSAAKAFLVSRNNFHKIHTSLSSYLYVHLLLYYFEVFFLNFFLKFLFSIKR